MLYVLILLIFAISHAVDKVYVVQRERSSLAVVYGDELSKVVENLGNLNHATLKFYKGKAYLISRDGFLSKIDVREDRLLKRVKVGKSSIGFTFCGGNVIVANYEPDTVLLLSQELKVLKEFRTRSRNVGIKAKGSLAVFSLMDRDSIWVIDCERLGVLKKVRNVGQMPFDALLSGDRYLVGFFKDRGVGVLDMEELSYRKITFREGSREVTFKIPHFGLWGVWKDTAYIPSVGEREIKIINLRDFVLKGSIELPGLPVFVSVSPDGKYVAVNYSGDMEDYLSLIDRKKGKVVKTAKLGDRIMHFRFSPDGRFIYLSSYFENLLKKVKLPELEVVGQVPVATPSGVFIYSGGL